MKRSLLVIIVVLGWGGGARAQITGGTFEATGSDVFARYFHAGSRLANGPVMVSGGLNVSFIPLSLVSRGEISFFDPATGMFSAQFTPLEGGPAISPVLSVPRSSHTQTSLLDGRVLITGGHRNASGTSPGQAFAGVEIFDPNTGTVSTGPSMAANRAMHTADLLADGRVCVAGGVSWQVFDPATDSWSPNYTLARSRVAHASVLLADYAGVAGDDRVLLIGGGGTGPATMEVLNPADGTTALLSSTLRVGVDDLAAALLPDGRVLIVGGQNVSTGDTVALADIFDPVTDTLVSVADVPNRPDGIADHRMVALGEYVAVFGGEQQASGTDTVLDYAALFDGVTASWFDDGAMIYLHDDFVSVPLGVCEVLLIDGGVPFLGQEVPSSACEIFRLTIPGQCFPGDCDGDGDTDLDDYFIFAGCAFGPGGGLSTGCDCFDFDGDGDVTLADFAELQQAFGGE